MAAWILFTITLIKHHYIRDILWSHNYYQQNEMYVQYVVMCYTICYIHVGRQFALKIKWLQCCRYHRYDRVIFFATSKECSHIDSNTFQMSRWQIRLLGWNYLLFEHLCHHTASHCDHVVLHREMSQIRGIVRWLHTWLE